MPAAAIGTDLELARKAAKPANRWTSGPAIVLYVAAVMFITEMLVASRYGFHVDELYFLACSEHLAWGYIDQAPLIVLLTYLSRHLFGDSLLALHLLPALAAAALVWTVGGITRELGGGRFAQALSAIAVLVTPAYLLFHHLMHIVAFEPLLWAGCSYFAVRAIKYDAAENWLYAGVLAGLGLENKYTIAVLLFGLLLGLLATQARKSLLAWQLWGGVGLALLLFAPNLIWETVHHFPLLEWQKYIRAHPEVQTFNFSAAGFFGNQVLYTLPVFALWIAGLWFFLFSAKGRQFRFLGIAALAVIGFGLSSGKSHYAIPIYAILYTGGAIAVETLTERANRRWLRRILIEVVVVAGIILAPCFLPILPVDVFAFYQRFLHLPLPIRSESYEYGSELPSQLAWELNWDELVTAVARVYNSLPDDEKSKAGIMTQTYGEAGAIDLLGKKYGLPKAISGQLSYYDFGTRNYTGEVLITVGMDPRMVAQKCRSVTSGAYIDKSYGYTTEVILVCKGFPLQDWPAFKHY